VSRQSSAWMPFYVGDYLGDTQRLTTEQHGAYLLLILDYWRNGPAPDDDAVLQQITKLERAAWKRHRAALARMFKIEEGEWRHKRIDHELVEAEANAERRSSKALKAAQARWGNAPSNAPSMPGAKLVECPPQSPSPKNDDPYGSLSENDVSDPPAELPDDGDGELPEEPENSLKPQHVVDEWNQVALRCGLPQIVGLTGKRLRHLKSRIREHPLDHWFEAFNAIERNPWMHGENDRGWRADFDFLLQPSSFQKLIEGSYDRAQPIQRTQ
jgi:uncharacterized protein YdaU (DUF1376 family)